MSPSISGMSPGASGTIFDRSSWLMSACMCCLVESLVAETSILQLSSSDSILMSANRLLRVSSLMKFPSLSLKGMYASVGRSGRKCPVIPLSAKCKLNPRSTPISPALLKCFTSASIWSVLMNPAASARNPLKSGWSGRVAHASNRMAVVSCLIFSATSSTLMESVLSPCRCASPCTPTMESVCRSATSDLSVMPCICMIFISGLCSPTFSLRLALGKWRLRRLMLSSCRLANRVASSAVRPYLSMSEKRFSGDCMSSSMSPECSVTSVVSSFVSAYRSVWSVAICCPSSVRCRVSTLAVAR